MVETNIEGQTRFAVFFLHTPFDSKNASDAMIGFHLRSSVAEIFHFSSHLKDIPVPLVQIYLSCNASISTSQEWYEGFSKTNPSGQVINVVSPLKLSLKPIRDAIT